MRFFFLLIIFFVFSANVQAKVCEINLIKNLNELKEKIKICDKGDKLYLNYDMTKLIGEELVENLCNLKYTVLLKDETKVIYKRKSGSSLICIFEPSKKIIN